MECYVGFDIGTTNLKCLTLCESGKILETIKFRTPQIVYNGLLFFDLRRIEEFIDSSLAGLRRKYDIKSIGFSTIGESIVALKGNKPIFNPPLWNQDAITSTEEERITIEKHATPETIGTFTNPLFSIHKILWLKHNIEGINNADLFLPLSSYLAYRKTNIAAWDYSQAARSGMFDVKKKVWIKELLDIFSIPLPEKILPMGSSIGVAEGISYGLGGHDHIVGFYGITKALSNTNKQIYYSSMGTSEVLATLVNKENIGSFMPSEKGYIIPAFIPDYYIATRSFRNFGSMLNSVRRITGYIDDYAKESLDISRLESKSASCLFSCSGDFLSSKPSKGFLNILEATQGSTSDSILESAYLYLSSVSRIMMDDLARQYTLDNDAVLAIGGGITKNTVFTSYLATAIGMPTIMLDTEEISALGAALVGLSSFSKKKVHIGMNNVYPNEKLQALVENTLSRYRKLV